MQVKKGITIRKKTFTTGKYIIKIDGKIEWEGRNPQTKLPSMLNDFRGKDISISWKSDREFLIV